MSRKANSYYSVTTKLCEDKSPHQFPASLFSAAHHLQKSISFQKKLRCKRKSIRLETFLLLPTKSFFLCVQTSEVERRRLNLHFLFNFPSGQNCNALAYQITFLRPSESWEFMEACHLETVTIYNTRKFLFDFRGWLVGYWRVFEGVQTCKDSTEYVHNSSSRHSYNCCNIHLENLTSMHTDHLAING